MPWGNNYFPSSLRWQCCPGRGVPLWIGWQPFHKFPGGIGQESCSRSHYCLTSRPRWKTILPSTSRLWRAVWQIPKRFQWRNSPILPSFSSCMGPSACSPNVMERNASGKNFRYLECEWDPRRGRSRWRSCGPLPAAVDPMEQTQTQVGRQHIDLTDPILAGMRCFHLDYFLGWGGSENHRR